jgi:hypothetical protein
MKVWVPIDLPEGAVIEHVTASDMTAPHGRHFLKPFGPPCSDPKPLLVMSSRDHWKYEVMLRNQHTEGNFMDDVRRMGEDGWELFLTCAITSAGVEFWFRRRVS